MAKVPMKKDPYIQQLVLTDITKERTAQDKKWGDQVTNTNQQWNVIAIEEVGEVAREIYEQGDGLYNEIIQTAAVYVAWAEALLRWMVPEEDEI